MFVLVLFWFQLFNGFSGSNAIDDLSLIFFNLLFTAVPPMVCGIFDKDVPDPLLTITPELSTNQDKIARYKPSNEVDLSNKPHFLLFYRRNKPWRVVRKKKRRKTST